MIWDKYNPPPKQPGESCAHRRIVLHRNGDPIHFDVTVDFEAIALAIGHRAEKNRSHVSVEVGGAVVVVHIP